jgi:acetyl esterase/lipase
MIPPPSFRRFAAVLAGLFLGAVASAAGAQEVVKIWPGVAPGSEAADWSEKTIGGDDPVVRNVTVPTLTVFRPPAGQANGTAVIIAPGGGFRQLTLESEGYGVARWLNARGVTAFVLKYRLVRTSDVDIVFRGEVFSFLAKVIKNQPRLLEEVGSASVLPAADAQQALRLVRERAATWGVDPHRVGMIGFSAGGTVTMRTAVAADPAARPDFVAAIYGVALPASVPKDAPPLFLAVASDDTLALETTTRVGQDWRDAGLPVELHVYPDGGHGFGVRQQGKSSDRWLDAYGAWLESRGLLKPQR